MKRPSTLWGLHITKDQVAIFTLERPSNRHGPLLLIDIGPLESEHLASTEPQCERGNVKSFEAVFAQRGNKGPRLLLRERSTLLAL